MTILLNWLRKGISKVLIPLITILAVFVSYHYVSQEWSRVETERLQNLKTHTERISLIRKGATEHFKDAIPRDISKEDFLARTQKEIDQTEGRIKKLKNELSWYTFWKWGVKKKLKANEKTLAALKTIKKKLNSVDNPQPVDSMLLDFIAVCKSYLGISFKVLIYFFATQLILKISFYYLLAPACERAAPLRLVLVDNKNSIKPHATPSAVSLDIHLAGNEEVLLRQGFLQDSSHKSKKHIKYLLNIRYPFTSLLSGMFGLTCVRAQENRHAPVIVSSQNDSSIEVGMLEIPEGQSVVLKTKALAGIVKNKGQSIEMTQHWRLKKLHAWLTWQLRFIAFHGPCKIIVQGCRGVRFVSPELKDGRMINQESTLGFSTNLRYKCVRTETFPTYLVGLESLFNDHFSGSNGYYVTEEMPNRAADGSKTKGKLEGFADAILKVFGI